ncbi:hypothetical protein [Absidia glauca]|uniref:SWIM-type domain-containing protein n=1 Tax=Absidia glauca TaxID=4829 RepID=A0A168MVE3_ABSGL|nr:hypothetical protein [Absidia glauca]
MLSATSASTSTSVTTPKRRSIRQQRMAIKKDEEALSQVESSSSLKTPKLKSKVKSTGPKSKKVIEKKVIKKKTTKNPVSAAAELTPVGTANPSSASSSNTVKRTGSEAKAKAPKKSKPVIESLITEEEADLLPEMRGRIERARREKIYVVSRNPINSTTEEFTVTGSTGNLYSVKIGPSTSCSCRDFIHRRRHCKHILVILLKMFHLHPSSPIFRTIKPSQNVLRDIFSTCIPDPTALVPEALKALIDKKMHGEPVNVEIKTERRPLDSSDCPVCCDEFDEAKVDGIVFCIVCGNNIHKICFETWKRTRGANVTCVFCRSPWEDPFAPKKPLPLSRNHEGFVNFGMELGLSNKRDTSTYGQ